MTYILLKVTELLSLNNPNINVRYHSDKNSDIYLKRCCEVNYLTNATPALHSDKAVMTALGQWDYPIEEIRDWDVVGCVEPCLGGKHFGQTTAIIVNIIAALEMAMNNGHHPLMDWTFGPETGSIEDGDFKTFDDFFKAFETQYKVLIDQAIELNNMLGQAYHALRPCPLLSSMIEGCVESGKDILHGGAKYNSTGAALVGLADVTDSMMAIRKLVFDDQKVSFRDLKQALDSNFENAPVIRTMADKKVPFFGSDSEEASEMANRIAKFSHDSFSKQVNYRNAKHRTGFWTMSNHVAFGKLSGASPNGRLAGKAFTPGLTPSPGASKNLLDNIRDVARLDPKNMDNNIAFNVNVVPNETHEEFINHLFSYTKTYFELGGMQIQFNITTTEMMRDAIVHPENYRTLIVRISGYNAYFVSLNRDMQIELIERAEYEV